MMTMRIDKYNREMHVSRVNFRVFEVSHIGNDEAGSDLVSDH